MIVTACVALGALFYYFPGFEENLLLSIVGTFALIFGLYSILFGFYNPAEGVGKRASPVIPSCACSGDNRKH
jgi:hypothetical protein